MKKLQYLLPVIFLLGACNSKEAPKETVKITHTVSNDGSKILFSDTAILAFFKTEKVSSGPMQADFTAVGIVGATIQPSTSGASENIVLFENPELASNYTELIQHQINIRQIKNINIRQKQIELERTQDLLQHGSATGQELLNAQTSLSMEETSLANEKTALIEHEARLKAAGYDSELLKQTKAGTAFIICDIPENQIDKLKKGNTCRMIFTAFPNEEFTGKINAVADMVDNSTRMVKVRIEMNNPSSKLKSGMFTSVTFRLEDDHAVSIEKHTLVTVQGRHYVFVKSTDNGFERREIHTGQQIGDRIIVFNGLDGSEEIATEGVMQLKGLSFGY